MFVGVYLCMSNWKQPHLQIYHRKICHGPLISLRLSQMLTPWGTLHSDPAWNFPKHEELGKVSKQKLLVRMGLYGKI